MSRKLSDKERKKIIADFASNENYSETARLNGVSRNTVKNIVSKDKEFARKCHIKKEENAAEILDALGEQAPKVAEFCEKGLNRLLEILPYAKNARDIATAMGIMIDKYTGISPKKADNSTFELPARVIAPSFASVFLAIVDEMYTEYELAGGRGSTKSSFVSLVIVWLIKNVPEIHALCIRKVANTLRDSVYAQIQWAISTLRLETEFKSTVSPLEITLTATGQKIYFRGTDDSQKLKSITPPFGFIGVLWFEELDQFAGDEEIRNIRQSVIRGGSKAYVFKTYNPPKSVSNWVNKLQKIPKPGRLLHKSTYLDVPPKWLGRPFIDEANFVKDVSPDAYEHEYMGIANGAGGLVFENLQCREITDEEIAAFDRIYNGVDWGFYPDPWAFNQMHFDAARRVLYIFGELTKYKSGNRATADALQQYGITENDLITADSSEPKSVQDYKNYGFYCRSAIKGPGSVEYSHKWLQSLSKIVIDHKRCPDTYREFSEYEYERTRDGEIMSGYPDKNNHHIDAVRYAMESVWKKRGQ